MCVVLLAAFSITALSAQTKPRLAILPFTGGTGEDGETIAQLFSYERELSAVFTIVPRTSSLEAIMKEQQFQRFSGLTDSDTIARLGRQYNADYVVAGHIRTLGARKLALITIIHVESLRQIAGDYQEYTGIEELPPMIPGMAKRIVAASRTSGTSLPQLAALPFAVPAGVEPGDAETLAQLLAVEIANSGKYAVLPRTTTIQAVMAEHRIQRSGLTDPDTIKVIGEALNARYVLAGSVRSLGQTNLFTAEIINIETGSQLTGYAVNYRAVDDGLKLMAELSSKLTGIISPRALDNAKAVKDRQRAEERQRRTDKTKAKWEGLKDNAYIKMIQFTGFAFQSDKDFAYFFDEIGVRWSFLPFTSIGLDLAFGGNTRDPVSKSTSYYRNGERYGRAEELKAMGLKEEMKEPVFYGYAAMSAGLAFPFSKKDSHVRLYLFGDGLVQYGTTVYPGLFGDSLTPGFDMGLVFGVTQLYGAGLNIKYKRLWYKNNKYTNGITVGFTLTL
jgi:TolB-like protein